ncbi:uncharacterized protein LOC107423523 [Ziziphus jujuba]|uniref:Uncharacterized protein LOC107423523 n=1 Tax=Ziziphus jujuba TaxID=326968 RepID=A0ABM3IRK2_ZIZJJ|nr:uncharacterized protein LOC107423523 [Ziziphus jujuba]
MAKPLPSSSSSSVPEPLQKMLSPTATISDDIPLQYASQALGFLKDISFSAVVPDHCKSNDFYSNLIGGVLKPLTISRGRVSCLLTVKPAVTNYFLGLHGGAVAAVAEAISIACARTVVAEDTEIFLGELSMSYLSGAPLNSEVIVDGNVVRSGRNITVISVDFKLKKTSKLVFTARATFYNMPVAKL